jgi:type I restriction enzyme S subunit
MALPKWQPRRLDELGFVGRGKSRHRPRNDARLYGGPHPFIQTADVMAADPYITTYSQTYSEFGLQQSKAWPSNTLCMTISGANTAKTAILRFPACFPDSVVGFIADNDRSDLHFVKYSLDLMRDRFLAVSRGATQDNLSLDKLLSFPILAPDVQEQRRIAGILSAYDELIENSQRRIKILESMARALYREWFVHFRFPGHESVPRVPSPLGEIPQGWEVTTLGRLVEIKKGKNITKDTIRDGTVPVVAGGIAPAYFHDTPNTQSPVITISASGANAGFVNLYYDDVWASDCSYIDTVATPHVFYYYSWLDYRRAAVTHLQRGSAQPHVYPKDLALLEALRAPDDLLNAFRSQIEPIFALSKNLTAKVENLRRTRDLLLPRLLSGQIDVEALDHA